MLVHGVEIGGGLFVGLAAGQEGDARHRARHAVLEDAARSLRDLFDAGAGFAAFLPGTTMFGLSTMPSSATLA